MMKLYRDLLDDVVDDNGNGSYVSSRYNHSVNVVSKLFASSCCYFRPTAVYIFELVKF